MKIRISKKKVVNLFLYLYLFIFFYFPRFVSTNNVLFTPQVMFLVVAVLMIPYIANNVIRDKDMYGSKRVWGYCIFIFLASSYYLFRYSISTNQFSLVDTRFVQNIFPVVVVVNLLVIVSIMRKWGYTREDGIELVLILASLQGIISVLMLFIQPLKQVANQLYLNYATWFNLGDYILTTRIYGISSDYTYGMPIIHGLLCGISFYLGLVKGRKYFYYTAFIFISVFLNSRTGILVSLICILLVILLHFKSFKISKRSVTMIILFPVLLILFLMFIQENYNNLFEFAMVLFEELYRFFFEQETVGTINYLINTNFYLPNGLEFIFGEGHRVYGYEAQLWNCKATDVGIVNDMFMGGLIYLFFRYGALLVLVLGVEKNKFTNLLKIMLLSTWLIANIKGQVTVNAIIVAVYIYILFCFYFLHEEEGQDV